MRLVLTIFLSCDLRHMFISKIIQVLQLTTSPWTT